MPKQVGMKGNLDDVMQRYVVTDFSGGLNSELDKGDIPENTLADCENVKFYPGRAVGRDGYIERITGLSDNGDGVFFFYDSNGNRRLVTFANGNLYDTTDFTATLVASGVYTAGLRVCAAVLNSILYFSDGETIYNNGSDDSGIRYYDPATSLVTAPGLMSSESVGTIPTPACKVMLSYNGALILGDIKYTGGTYSHDAVMFSNTNDPTTIYGTSIYQLSQGQGGRVNCLVALGVASVGITPFQAIFVGKSEQGVFLLKGALTVSDLSSTIINAPVGVLDGASAQFIPGPDGSGYVIWLGTDRRVWYTNGVISQELSASIRTELAAAVSTAISSGTYKFTSARNNADYLYMLDVGSDVQYCYNWDLKNWTRYRGWPSGYWCSGKDSSSQDVMFVVDSEARLCQANIGLTDGGEAIDPYVETGWLNVGDSEVLKVWRWLYVAYRTDQGQVDFVATPNLGVGTPATGTLTPTIVETNTSDLVWGVGLWGEAVWGGVGVTQFAPYKSKKRITVPVSGTSERELLKGYDVKMRFTQSVSGARFEILGFALLYTTRGRIRVA